MAIGRIIVVGLLVVIAAFFLVPELGPLPGDSVRHAPVEASAKVSEAVSEPVAGSGPAVRERVEIGLERPPPAPTGRAVLRFLVRYRESGKPVTGGQVVLSDGEPGSWDEWLEIDGSGRAKLELEGDEEIALIGWWARGESGAWHGFAPGRMDLEADAVAAASARGEAIVVEVEQGRVVLRGSVVDARNSQTIAGATIAFDVLDEESDEYRIHDEVHVVSDAFGRYEISGITASGFPPDVAWDLRAAAPGYQPYDGSLTRMPDQAVVLEDIEMHRGCVVSGRVVGEGGEPIPYCSVGLVVFRGGSGTDDDEVVDVSRVRTRESNEFSFEAVPLGDVIELSAASQGYPTQVTRIAIDRKLRQDVTLRLVRGVRFKVVPMDQMGRIPDRKRGLAFLRSANGDGLLSRTRGRDGVEFCAEGGTPFTAVVVIVPETGDRTMVMRGERAFTTRDGVDRIEVVANEPVHRPRPSSHGAPSHMLGFGGGSEQVAAYFDIRVLDANGAPHKGSFGLELPMMATISGQLKGGRFFIGLPPCNHFVRYQVDGAWIGGFRLVGREYEVQELSIRLDN